MPAIVLPPGQLSFQHSGIERRHLLSLVVVGNAKILCPQKFIDRTCCDDGHVAALVIQPPGIALIWNAITDEREAGRAEGEQFVGVDGQVTPGFGAKSGFGGTVFHVISCHPVIFSTGEALDGFTEYASMKSGAPFAGGADQANLIWFSTLETLLKKNYTED